MDVKRGTTFIVDYLDGICSKNDIDQYVQHWHSTPQETRSLHEFLGFSFDEYEMWVTDPMSLEQILTMKA